MEVKKSTETTQKKTNLIQEEYPIYIGSTHLMVKWNKYKILFLYQVSLLLCSIISTLFLYFFHLHPYMESFFKEKLSTLVSFIFSVPQERTIVMNGYSRCVFKVAQESKLVWCFTVTMESLLQQRSCLVCRAIAYARQFVSYACFKDLGESDR